MNRVLVWSVTDAGAALSRRLPYEHRHGQLVSGVRQRWADVDGLVLVCATGIAVRAIAPLLADKAADPAVVVVDDGGRFVVALTGGHQGGANVLAREVAELLGAQPVVTTATDAAGLPALDNLPGFTATGDIAAVTRAWLDGSPPTISVDPALAGWPLPPALAVGVGRTPPGRVRRSWDVAGLSRGTSPPNNGQGEHGPDRGRDRPRCQARRGGGRPAAEIAGARRRFEQWGGPSGVAPAGYRDVGGGRAVP